MYVHAYGCVCGFVCVCVSLRDSSDDQQVSLWTSALTSPHINQRRDRRRLMKRRISVATRRRSVTGQHRSKEPEDTAENSDSSPVIFDSDSDTRYKKRLLKPHKVNQYS